MINYKNGSSKALLSLSSITTHEEFHFGTGLSKREWSDLRSRIGVLKECVFTSEETELDESITFCDDIARTYGFQGCQLVFAARRLQGKYHLKYLLPGGQRKDILAFHLEYRFSDPFIHHCLNSTTYKIWRLDKDDIIHLDSRGKDYLQDLCRLGIGTVAAIPWRDNSGNIGVFKLFGEAYTLTTQFKFLQLSIYVPIAFERLTKTNATKSVSAEPLTSRESQIIDLYASGYSCQQIAADLGISNHTVVTHTKNIYRKLGVSNRQQAIVKSNCLYV